MINYLFYFVLFLSFGVIGAQSMPAKPACKPIREGYAQKGGKIQKKDMILKRYQLISQFTSGKGGAQVFKVRDTKDNLTKVMKVFAVEDFAKSMEKNANMREIYITCLLGDEKHFPKMYEFGLTTAENPFDAKAQDSAKIYPFVVMELVSGESLLSLAKKDGRAQYFSIDTSKEMVRQIVAALMDAFNKYGFVHRDLHPGNIIWDSQARRIKIIDFGLSSVRQFHQADKIDAKKLAEGSQKSSRPWSAALVNFGQHLAGKAGSILEKSPYTTAFLAKAEDVRDSFQGGDDVQFVNMTIYAFRNFFGKGDAKAMDRFGTYCPSLSECHKMWIFK